MFKKFSVVAAILVFLAGCAVVNWTGLSAIKFDGTQSPEITFGNGETISNATDGTLDFGAANLATTGTVTTTGAVYLASFNYGTANNTAGTDSYTVTMTNSPAAYATGMAVIVKADTANTGACAMRIGTLAWKPLKSLHDADPADDYIEAGSMFLVVYDGTNFQILSPDANP